jgi:hypothetical protein
MARDTVSNVIERVRRSLASTVRMEINVLGASLNDTDTTVQLSYALTKSLRSGAVLSIGSELLRVIEVDDLAKTVEVLRGWQDSSAQTHASGDEVLINPRFTRFDIFDAIVEEIETWAPDIFYVEHDELAVTDESYSVELPADKADALAVISVHRNWTEDDRAGVWPEMDFTLQRGTVGTWSATTLSGLLIRFTSGGSGRARAGKVLITLARPYDPSALTEDSDLFEDLGLDRSQMELVELGVKYRLMMDDEQGRSARNAQDEPRRNEEVPPNAAASMGQVLMQRYDRRRAQEMTKLRSRYPLRFW